MSQEQLAARVTPHKAFGQKSDTTFWIILGVAVALVAALGLAQWASTASTEKTAAKPEASVQAQSSSADPVYRCAGRVSFKPCS